MVNALLQLGIYGGLSVCFFYCWNKIASSAPQEISEEYKEREKEELLYPWKKQLRLRHEQLLAKIHAIETDSY